MRDANVVVDDSTITSHIKRIRRKFLALDPVVRAGGHRLRHGIPMERERRDCAARAMKPPRFALGIRAQLLLVLTVFLADPVARLRVRAGARAVPARIAGAHARRHRAGGRHRAARPAGAVRRRPRLGEPLAQVRNGGSETGCGAGARDRRDPAGPVAHDGAHLRRRREGERLARAGTLQRPQSGSRRDAGRLRAHRVARSSATRSIRSMR